MKHILQIISITLLLAITSQIAFGLSITTKGKILENFKLQEQEMIFQSDTLLDEEDKNILSTYKKL